jgi:hypothetical protein
MDRRGGARRRRPGHPERSPLRGRLRLPTVIAYPAKRLARNAPIIRAALAHLARRRLGQVIAVLVALVVLGWSSPVLAQKAKPPPPRDVQFQWGPGKTQIYVGVSFRDAIDATILNKLNRGLPTTIVLTAAIYRPGVAEPLSTTAQSCKITWHVWKEVYFVEVTRPGGTRVEKTLTTNGVLRRCAEIQSSRVDRLLPAGTRAQIPDGVPLYMEAKVQVNPVSADVLTKIKRWVSRPTGTGTAAPGDALFSTFTGLFLQRIGKAERQLDFTTKTVLPLPPPPPPKE